MSPVSGGPPRVTLGVPSVTHPVSSAVPAGRSRVVVEPGIDPVGAASDGRQEFADSGEIPGVKDGDHVVWVWLAVGVPQGPGELVGEPFAVRVWVAPKERHAGRRDRRRGSRPHPAEACAVAEGLAHRGQLPVVSERSNSLVLLPVSRSS